MDNFVKDNKAPVPLETSCGKVDAPRQLTVREQVVNRIDNVQSNLMFKLGELQKIRDSVRFSSDTELGLALEILDRIYVFNN